MVGVCGTVMAIVVGGTVAVVIGTALGAGVVVVGGAAHKVDITESSSRCLRMFLHSHQKIFDLKNYTSEKKKYNFYII